MEILQAINELQENAVEIRKQYRRKRLRRLLRFLLIGFLIGRDSDKRISELTSRNDSIIDSLFKRFEGFQHEEKRIKELADVYTRLTRIMKMMPKLKEEPAEARNSILNIEESLRKYHSMIVAYVKRAIEQNEHAIEKGVGAIANSHTYLIYDDKQRCIDDMKSFEEDLNYVGQSDILNDEYIAERRRKLEKNRQTVLDYNKGFILQRKRDYSHLWSKGLGTLDDEQQTAIVTDDKHNLVTAAAGSGKTETLITRIAYLIARKPDSVQAERILAIAYQRKAKEEIEQRLLERYSIRNVNARTFHKLGKDILEHTGKKLSTTDIVNENKKHEAIQKIFSQKIKSELDYYKLFLTFAKTLYDHDEKESVNTKNEALTYAHEQTCYAIDRTKVNSRAEKEIMDFLLTSKLNGKPIEVKYEPDLSVFRPDFCLPEYSLYIEHWALNEKGEVPTWFNQTSEEYRQTMEMKKKWFAENNKLLVETFTHEYRENNPEEFIELLKKRMTEKLQEKNNCNYEFTLKTYEEIVELVWESCRTPVDDIVNFITSAKTYGLSPARVGEKLRNNKWTRKQLAFGNLALPAYHDYEVALTEHNKIDFEDMINKAIDELKGNPSLLANAYDHILIDEYQDISAQRYKLISKLLERNPRCKLFCVGDDWQSIMGFSGSNLNFFVNFEQYFAKPAVTVISTNYRSVKTIVDAGAELIRNNTTCQMQKPTLSNRKDLKPITIVQLLHREGYEKNYYRQMAEDCLDRITAYIHNGYSPQDILVLSRFMRTRTGHGFKFLYNIGIFIEKAKENGISLAYEKLDARNKVRLLTAHRSKGLEAKVVFLLNATKGTYGFPSEIEDSSLYEPARENYPIQDQKEEERRLFYVAMTRAIEDLYIYTWEPAMSEFLKEIADYTIEEKLHY
jgi:DNA helicase-4